MLASWFPSKLKAATILLLALAAFSIAEPQLTNAAVPSPEYPIADAGSDQLSPTIGANNIVVWEDKRDGKSNIYGKNLSTGQEFLVASGLSAKRKPVTNGNVVIWEDDRSGTSDLYVYYIPSDLSTPGEECAIVSGPGEQRKAAVSGDTVVWQDDRSGRWEIYSSKIPANCSTPATESSVSIGEGNKTNPSISGNTIVWQDDRGGPGSSSIYAKDLSTGQEFAVSTGAAFMDTPAISGSIVVWRQESPNNYDIFGRDLMAKDLETGQVFQITSDTSDQVSPAISGNVVVWEDHRNGGANIYGKDLSTGVEFQITSGATPTTSPRIDGEIVVWESQYQGEINYGNYDVLGTNLDLAPGIPSGVKATGTSAGVDLLWTKNPEGDVIGYNIYRGGSADGSFEKLNTTSVLVTPSYSDALAPKGEASYYRVTAMDGGGNESAPSTAINAAALAQTSVSLEAFPPRLDLGEATTLSGKLMRSDVPLSGKRVAVEQSPAGRNTFSLVASGNLTTGSDGSFLLASVKPRGDTDYRVRYAGEARSGLLASTSSTKRVDVVMPSSLSLTANPLTVNYGGATTLSGRMTKNGAAVAGKRVILEHRPVGAKLFRSLGVRTTSASGRFSLAGVKPARNTDYRVRFNGDPAAKLLPSTSSLKRVRVLMPTSASLVASPSTLTFGQSTALSGKLTSGARAVADKRVVLEHRPVGAAGFSALRQINTNATGNFYFTGVKPAKNTDYRVRFAVDPAAGLQPTASATMRVNVKVAVSVNVSNTSPMAGQRVSISSVVSPLHTGSVKLTIKGGGRMVAETSISTSNSQSTSTPTLVASRFALTYKPPAPGTYEVQVTFAGDADHLGSSSLVKSFQVTQ